MGSERDRISVSFLLSKILINKLVDSISDYFQQIPKKNSKYKSKYNFEYLKHKNIYSTPIMFFNFIFYLSFYYLNILENNAPQK